MLDLAPAAARPDAGARRKRRPRRRIADRSERPRLRGWADLVLGFAGVSMLLSLQLSGDLAGAGLLLAAAGYAAATLLLRRLRDACPQGISAATLAIATVLLAPGAATSFPVGATPAAWAALAALGMLCTASALYYQRIAEAG